MMSLEALEQSDMARLPGGIFTRAFIRAYALEVGLDPNRTIDDFIAELPPELATVTAHRTSVEDGEKLESDRKAVATAIRLALVSLPLIALAIYYDMHDSAPPSNATQASPTEVIGASQPQRAEPEPPAVASAAVKPEPAPVEAPQSGLKMEIAPRAPCWVSATADGKLLFSTLINPGETRVVTAREQIRLRVGDAGAFSYTLNGRRGRPLGTSGQVTSARITPSNIGEFSLP